VADVGSFERDTTYRILVEAVRHWIITHWLAKKTLPLEADVFCVYSDGPNGIDWGNPPTSEGKADRPLRGKRIRVTFEVEEF